MIIKRVLKSDVFFEGSENKPRVTYREDTTNCYDFLTIRGRSYGHDSSQFYDEVSDFLEDKMKKKGRTFSKIRIKLDSISTCGSLGIYYNLFEKLHDFEKKYEWAPKIIWHCDNNNGNGKEDEVSPVAQAGLDFLSMGVPLEIYGGNEAVKEGVVEALAIAEVSNHPTHTDR